jgi:hypothetical protein
MNSLHNLIKLLEPDQKPFISDANCNVFGETKAPHQPSSLLKSLQKPFDDVISQWKISYKLSDEDINKVEILPIGRHNSFYASLLYLIYQKYNMTCTYNQKTEMIAEFIRFIISQMETNMRIKSHLKGTHLRVNQLIGEIKNEDYQSSRVIYYLSLLFDLNIMILTSDECELYYSDDSYDDCKPHILFYKDSQIYYPIVYKTDTGTQLLTYYDHSFIKCLIDNFNKKIICHKNYAKKTKIEPTKKTSLDYRHEKVTDLREIAKSKGIDIHKISESSGRRIYKTKIELLSDLAK